MATETTGTVFLRPAHLEINWPDGRQETFTLEQTVTLIGRGEENDLVIPVGYNSISRQHIEIQKKTLGVYLLKDLGSTNGVVVNGIQVEQVQLSDQDEFVIGLPEEDQEIQFRFHLGTEAQFQYPSGGQIQAAPESNREEDFAGLPHIRVRWPNGQTNSYEIRGEETLIGRSPEASVQIPAAYSFVSARHFSIQRAGTSFTIVDLGSTNGTLLNNQPLTPNSPANLSHNAIIRIGDDELGVSLGMTFFNPQAGARPIQGYVAADPARPVAADSPITIGRLPNNEVVLDAPDVSRRHAQIWQREGKNYLKDLGSRNGTFVNQQRIGEIELFEGDLIEIGDFLLTFQDGEVTPYQSSGMRLDINDLTVEIEDRRGKFKILDSIDLSVLPREFIAIVGGSGAGKTTLLNALIGLRPGTGQVQLNGHDFYEEFEHFRHQMGYVPQSDILHTSLTVEKALDYTARLRLPKSVSPEERARRISAVLETVSMNSPITRKNQIGRLSGGQRKRVSIAAELIADPKLIYLDEATSGLDPGLEKKMMHTLRKMADEGRTVMLITHATNNIVQTDHVAFISQGKLVFFGPSQEALEFFEVEDFADIYVKIQNQGETWRQTYEQEKPELHQRYVQSRKQNAQALPRRELPSKKFSFADMLRQFLVLTQRSISVLFSDPVTLALMLLLLPLTGVLQLIIGSREILTGNPAILADPVQAASALTASYTPFPRMNTFIFVMGLEAVLTGLFVPSNDLVKERSIFLRERMVNLRVLPYLLSKATIYSLFVLIQVALYLLILSLGVNFPQDGLYFNGTLEIFITLFLTMMAGITFGFIISTVSRSTEMAIYMLTMMLFFQFFFAGTVFDLRGNTFEPLSYLTTTRWSLNALGVSVDFTEIVETTILCSEVPENPLDPASALETVCEPYPEAVDDLMLDYKDEMLLRSWGVLAGMSVLFLTVTGVLLGRTRAY
jgi:ABC-type multidrug transport system ATPase subunit/predicted component of type VI protein secretion system